MSNKEKDNLWFDLIFRGYFPKELPNCFNTFRFALECERLYKCIGKKCKKESKSISFTISKGKLSRRYLNVINPQSFLQLSKFVIDNNNAIRQ